MGVHQWGKSWSDCRPAAHLPPRLDPSQANAGLFETILGPEDAVISDALNHASIIDGIRLCKAERHRYAHCDMDDLEEKLKASQVRPTRAHPASTSHSSDARRPGGRRASARG